MTNYGKYYFSKGTHWISNSGADENGRVHGGKAGDQNGREWTLRGWYDRPWTCVLRHPDALVQGALARLAVDAALNDRIGYDQFQRGTYWTRLKEAGCDPAAIQTACSADCTAGVAANARAVGTLYGIEALTRIPEDVYSGNMRAAFRAAGFTVLTDRKLLTDAARLLPGDILLYDGHHAATNVTVGALVKWVDGEALYWQRRLIEWNPDCLPEYGVDGEWGAETERALRAYQTARGVRATGRIGVDLETAFVTITGGTVNVRSAPWGEILGVVKRGDSLPYRGTTDRDGWMRVGYRGNDAYVRNTMGRVVE